MHRKRSRSPGQVTSWMSWRSCSGEIIQYDKNPDGILVVNKENHIKFVNFTLANVSLNDAGLYNIQGDNDTKPLSADDQVLFI